MGKGFTMKDCTEKFTNGNKILRIFQDTDAENPRKMWDNFGVMVCVHNRYDLGDSDSTGDEQDIIRQAGSWEKAERRLIAHYRLNKNRIVKILPLFLYDHGGITMRTGSFNDRWDSGQVGFIFATQSQVKECFIVGNEEPHADIDERVEKCLRGEVATYDQYLTGDVYGYQVTEVKHCDACGHDEEIDVDSCWGFYGSDHEASGLFDNAGWTKHLEPVT